jgi:hypothetical protein
MTTNMNTQELAYLVATYFQSVIYAPSAIADNEVTRHLDFMLETEAETEDDIAPFEIKPIDLLHEATNMFDLDEIIEAALQSATKIDDKLYIVDGAIPSKALENAVLRKLK